MHGGTPPVRSMTPAGLRDPAGVFCVRLGSPPHSNTEVMLDVIETEAPPAWDEFLPRYADVIFRVVRLFVPTYDERMDLFLFVCDRLREDDMRRVRAFTFRPEAPCRFSTYLAVVVRNLALDFLRARDGRYRPFKIIEALEPPDRLLFEYHLHEGRSLEESRGLLRDRHGIRMTASEAADRAGRINASLSATQRWRLLAQIYERREPVSIDPAREPEAQAGGDSLHDERADPEAWLRSSEAGELFRQAMESVPPRQRLALALKYRDGLTAREVGETLGITALEAERQIRDGLRGLRERLGQGRVGRPELESAELPLLWSRTGEEA